MAQPSPRFRRDLVASPVEEEGVAFVDVQDLRTGTNFRLYDFEYQLALQLNGQSVADVVAWASATYAMDLTAEGIAEFAGRLGELGFLEGEGPSAAPVQPAGASPSEQLDSREAEWLSLQSARTATYVPDVSMLDGRAHDLTPAAPKGAGATAGAGAGAGGRATANAVPVESSGVTELPSDALTEVPDSGPTRTPPPLGVARPNGGARRDSGAVAALASSADTARAPADSGRVRLAPAQASPPPGGMRERRQPPTPDAVVMAPFQEETSRGRFTAPPPERSTRRAPLVIVLLLIAAAAGGLYYYKWTREHPVEPTAVSVHVVSPKPTAVYRWFSTPGAVVDMGARTMAFESAGKITELLSSGTAFAAGDVLGKLQGAAAVEPELARNRSRVAFYEQLRDSMKAANNEAELKQAEAKLAEKKKLVEETQASLDKVVLRAPEPGQIVEVSAKVGAQAVPKVPVLKWKGKLPHAEFTVDEADLATASKLDFCRVEVSGNAPAGAAGAGGHAEHKAAAAEPARYVDCKLPPPIKPGSNARGGSPLVRFVVGLPPDSGLTVGQPLRLARLRYDAVFPLPLAAVVHGEGGADKVWVASAAGTAELRPITLAEAREEALVSQGLNVGDDVIVDAPADLKEGARVAVVRTPSP
jgi:hypothetical protein